jgi:hypothetical protein
MAMQQRESVRQMWEDFAAAILPADCSAVQRQEMRRAFFAGFNALLCALMAMGDDAVSEDEGAAWLEAWKQELVAFYADLKAGKV